MRSSLIAGLLGSLLLFSTHGSCQLTDFAWWPSLALKKDLKKKFTSSLGAEARFTNVLSPVRTVFLEAGVARGMSKRVDLALNYRFIRRVSDQREVSLRSRLYADVAYKLRIKAWRISYRLRGQMEVQNGVSDYARVPEWYARQKVGLRYSVDKKLASTAGVEVFHPLFDYGRSWMDEVRLSVGANYEISKRSEVQLSFMLKQDIRVPNPHRVFVVGMGYELNL